uniref:U-box domain-containing protein 4 n=1 Tax=Aegilops tauschii TaxID=37682 RepID=M8BY15_AEGTA
MQCDGLCSKQRHKMKPSHTVIVRLKAAAAAAVLALVGFFSLAVGAGRRAGAGASGGASSGGERIAGRGNELAQLSGRGRGRADRDGGGPARAGAGPGAGGAGRGARGDRVWRAVEGHRGQAGEGAAVACPTCPATPASPRTRSAGSCCSPLLPPFAEAAELGVLCREPPKAGKLQMQSDLDALAGKLDLNLRDCELLVKTGVLSDATVPSPPAEAAAAAASQTDVRELLARLQIGHAEAKHRAVEGLLDALREDEKSVLSALGRGNVAALVQLLTATAPKIREKAATVLCLLAESGSCEGLLVSEGALPPLIRLAESGSLVGREKAVITLQRLSMSPEIARAIVGHSGVRPLIEICQTGASIPQSAAAGALKNLSAVPEVRQALAEEGIVRVMISLLDRGVVLSWVPNFQGATATLMSCPANARDVKKDEKSVPNLVQLLDPSPGNTAKKYAISCLLALSASKRCKKLMIAQGAIGYLKKLSEMDVAGAKKLLEKLERGKLRTLFTRK